MGEWMQAGNTRHVQAAVAWSAAWCFAAVAVHGWIAVALRDMAQWSPRLYSWLAANGLPRGESFQATGSSAVYVSLSVVIMLDLIARRSDSASGLRWGAALIAAYLCGFAVAAAAYLIAPSSQLVFLTWILSGAAVIAGSAFFLAGIVRRTTGVVLAIIGMTGAIIPMVGGLGAFDSFLGWGFYAGGGLVAWAVAAVSSVILRRGPVQAGVPRRVEQAHRADAHEVEST